MSDADKKTDPVLKAIRENNSTSDIAILVALISAISSDQKDIKADIGKMKESLSNGTTNFATTDLRIQALASRINDLEQSTKQAATPKEAHWLIKSTLSTIAGAVCLAVVWFLMQGAINNAKGPTTVQNNVTTGGKP